MKGKHGKSKEYSMYKVNCGVQQNHFQINFISIPAIQIGNITYYNSKEMLKLKILLNIRFQKVMFRV